MFICKIKPFISIVVIIIFNIIAVMLGNNLMDGYFSFSKSIVFSWFAIITYISPLVFSFPFVYFSMVFIKGYEVAGVICSSLIIYYKYIIIISVFIAILFPVIYVNILNNRGYQSCNGTPLGWMVGMATQYVTDLSLCK